MTDREKQQELKETKPVRKAKAKAKANAKGKATTKQKGGKQKGSSPATPKGSKGAKAKAKAKQASSTKKPRGKRVKVSEAGDDDAVIPPSTSKDNRNSKKDVKKRPAKGAIEPAPKNKSRRSTSSGQAGVEKPSKSSRNTFARRKEPKPEASKAWWTSLHQAFDKVVKPKVLAPSTLEDGGTSSACVRCGFMFSCWCC